MNDPRGTDGTVGKALAVLDQVAAAGRPIRFTDLLAVSDYPKATLYRLIQTLVSQGMLAYDVERQTYGLGVRLVRLAHAAWRQSSLAPLARPHVDMLSEQTGETVHVAQLDHAQVLYVDKRNAAKPVEMYAEAGKVGPAYCTGVGKAMLAYLEPSALEAAIAQQAFHRYTPATICDARALMAELEQIRGRGHSYDREEHEPGIICVAMPVLSAGGQVLGALSVTTTTSRKNISELDAVLPDLRNAVAAIAEDVQAWRFPDMSARGGNSGGDGLACQE